MTKLWLANNKKKVHNSALVPEVQVKDSVEQSSMEGPRVPGGMVSFVDEFHCGGVKHCGVGHLLFSIQNVTQ